MLITQNIRSLHIIRGFAAFFVLLAHAKWPFWIGGTAFFQQTSIEQANFIDKIGLALAFSSSNGTAMVIMFYVLSGFIISHSYEKNRWTYRQFLVNRGLRIYIPYFASALIAGVLLFVSYKLARPLFKPPIKDYHQKVAVAYTEGLTFINFIKTLFFVKSERVNYFGFNYAYWSLLYETMFYLLFPLLLKHFKYVFIATAIIFPIHLFYHPLPEINHWYLYFTQYLFYFLAGMWLYKFLTSSDSFVLTRKIQLKKQNLFITTILFFLLSQLIGFTSFKALSFVAATSMAISWITYIVLYGVGTKYITKTFLFLGKISYSLYLIHIPFLLFFYSLVFYFFGSAGYISPWAYLPFALLVVPAALVFYMAFERLSLSLIGKYKRKLNKKPSAVEIIEFKAL